MPKIVDHSQIAPVLVVGAGPTGLTLALELIRRGISCRLIDKLPEPGDKSKALAIHARSLEMFETMGLAEKLIAEGNIVGGFSMHTGKTRLARVSTAEIDSPYPFILMLPQCDIERILTAQFISMGGSIERGVELVNLSEPSSVVTASLSHLDGETETAEFKWVVGCDGAHSIVRKLLKLPFEGTEYAEQFVLADVDIQSGIAEDEVSTYFHEDGALVFFPMGKHRFRTMANVAESTVSGDAPTLSFMQDLLDKRGPGDVKILKTHWLAWFRIHRRSVSTYRVGHTFVAGDAAHIHSPVGGQGMNTGMQDAYNLAWKLALVIQANAPDNLLNSYQEERHPVGQELIKGTDMATKLAFLRNPVAKQIRNHMMSFLSQQEVFVQRLRKVGTMLAVNYRSSPIVGEYRDMHDVQLTPSASSERPSLPSWMEFARASLPGDHAPDVVLTDEAGEQIRLYEALRGTKHSLLLFDGKPTEEGYRNVEQIAKMVKEQYGSLVNVYLIVADSKVPASLNFAGKVYLDPELTAHQVYGASSESLYLLRPDTYIGFRSQPAMYEPLHKHFTSVFGEAAALAH
ncbi:MAG: FAD-dependent monooxygenase [Candidatus Obscuribacterales bacterium]